MGLFDTKEDYLQKVRQRQMQYLPQGSNPYATMGRGIGQMLMGAFGGASPDDPKLQQIAQNQAKLQGAFSSPNPSESIRQLMQESIQQGDLASAQTLGNIGALFQTKDSKKDVYSLIDYKGDVIDQQEASSFSELTPTTEKQQWVKTGTTPIVSKLGDKSGPKMKKWYKYKDVNGDLQFAGETQTLPEGQVPEGNWSTTQHQAQKTSEYFDRTKSSVELYEKLWKERGLTTDYDNLKEVKLAAQSDSPLATKALQTAVANLFGGSTRAQAEIERFKSYGTLPERVIKGAKEFVLGSTTEDARRSALALAQAYEKQRIRPKHQDLNTKITGLYPKRAEKVVNPLPSNFDINYMTINELTNLTPNDIANMGALEKEALRQRLLAEKGRR